MPFFKGVLIQATGEAHSKLRGKAMEAISLLAVAVGLEVFSKDAKEVLNTLLLIQGMNLHFPSKISHTVPAGPMDEQQVPFLQQAWARLCKALGKDFVPYLPALVPPLVISAKLPADLKVVTEAESHTIDQERWRRLTFEDDKYLAINMDRIQEKSAALTMLFWLADELEEHFFTYVDKLVPVCEESLRFYHNEQVRIASASLIPCILKCITAYLRTSPQDINAAPHVQALFTKVLTDLLGAMEDEPNMDVLVSFLSSLQIVSETTALSTKLTWDSPLG